MSFLKIALFFLFFRIADFFIAYLAPLFIPYLGFFPYKEVAAQYNLPSFITGLANFDGGHYLLIARDGYQTYQQAFFPLYPLLIRWLSPLFSKNLLITALLISNVSFTVGLYLFSKYLLLILKNKDLVNWVVIFLLAFPTSFFFGTVYTEGLFFLLIVGTLYFLKKEKFLISALFAFFASLTKLVGLFLIIFFIFKLIEHKSNYKEIKNWKILVALFSPVLGLITYSLFLWQTTGDPLFFLNSQWAFGAHRSSSIVLLPQVFYRYLKIFFTAQFNFQYFISLFEFLLFTFVLVVLILDLIKNQKLKNKNFTLLALNLFSCVNLILPTLTGTLSSMPRYALFSLSFFIYLAQMKSRAGKILLGLFFAVVHIIIFGFFFQGYFVS